ncbi:MAG: PspC domain-containing protein [Actinobacteria bacterium]|nr:PspC domain-containing protein [Actinomycetota bacterium]
MTTTPGATTAPPAPPLLLRRPRGAEDRWLGVCAALGRATGTDPVLWRVAVVVLTVFGGTGLVLYVAGWLLVPEQGRDDSVADRLLRGRRPGLGTAVVLVALALALLAATDSGGRGLGPLLVVGLLGYLVVRRQARGEVLVAPAAGPVGTATGVVADPVPPAPRRPSGPPVGLATAAAVVLVTGVLLVMEAAGVDGLTVGRITAAALAVAAVGLAVSLRWRRGWPLAGLVLALSAVLGVVVKTGFAVPVSAGERTWVVTSGGERELGAGDAVLDLRGLRGPAEVEARLGLGRLEVLLPPGARVELDGTVAAGTVELLGSPDAGDGWDVEVDGAYGPATGPLLQLDLQVGYGELLVRR